MRLTDTQIRNAKATGKAYKLARESGLFLLRTKFLVRHQNKRAAAIAAALLLAA